MFKSKVKFILSSVLNAVNNLKRSKRESKLYNVLLLLWFFKIWNHCNPLLFKQNIFYFVLNMSVLDAYFAYWANFVLFLKNFEHILTSLQINSLYLSLSRTIHFIIYFSTGIKPVQKILNAVNYAPTMTRSLLSIQSSVTCSSWCEIF